MGGEIDARAGWAHYHRADRLHVDRGRLRPPRRPGPAGRRAALAGFALALALTAPVALNAATLASTGVSFAVTSTSDAVDASAGDGICRTAAGTCTLRAAIQQANALPGADTIIVPAGTYALAIEPVNQNFAANGDLDITDSVTISGAGAGSTVVDGGMPKPGAPPQVHGLDRLFEVSADGGAVTFSGLTFSDGYADEYGGAIANSSNASVTVVSSILTRNVAGKMGGALDNHFDGTVEVRGSTLSDNYAPESGSALNNNRGGSVILTDSTVSTNSAADVGLDEGLVGAGAISNNAELDARGTIAVTDSRIDDNRAGGGRSGAGISNDGAGTVTVDRTTFSKNRALADGGAIFNADGEVTVSSSTFSENAGKDGGAIASSGLGLLRVSDSTFTKNSASDWGGAVYNGNKGGASIQSSSFAENVALNGGAFANEGAGLVTVAGSTFTKNTAFDTDALVGGEGGGMHSNSGGVVEVGESTFTENRAVSGGGLSNEGGGQVTITSSRFSANRAEEAGGGILVQSGDVRMVDLDVLGNVSDSPLEGGGGISYAGDKAVSVGDTAAIEGSRIRNNTAKGDGGGIDSRGDGPLVVTTSAITGNTAAIGGAIHHVGDAPIEVTRSILYGNTAENGGAIFSDGDGEATVENSTVSGNRAAQFGGGLLVSSQVTVRNSTVAVNSAASGGGINNGGGDLIGDGAVFLANTIVAASPTGGNCAGTMTSRGGNVDSANTCQLREPTDQPGTDPLLASLAANGGPTQTHALLAGSPAQERAVCTELDPCPTVDQRGVERPAFDRVDAGAYESELAPSGGGGQSCTGRTERSVLADYDSWISQSAQGANFGGDSILKVGAPSNGSGRALVHFPLPSVPPGCELVGATLRLYSSSATTGRTLETLRIGAAWDESGVTWSNQPTTAGPAAATGSELDFRAWDVLAQTLAMYTLGDHGFLIRDAGTSGGGEQSFHSSERVGDRPPELVLVFDDPDGTPTPGFCGTTPQSLAADRDSWVSQGSPTNNFGSDSTLKVKSQGGANSRAVVGFPLPTLPSGCTGIASATLRLEASSAKEGRTLEAVRVAASWSESGVTWVNQPAASGPATSIPSVDGPLAWAVTAEVIEMYRSTNNGFLVRDAHENGVGDEQTLNSRHKVGDGPPELILVFDDSTPETTIDSGPVSPTTSTNALFTFSSDPTDSEFECSLDDGAFAACTSPHAFRELEEGVHVARVRATRNVRAVDPTPAAHTWTVAIPPETWVEGPDSPSASSSATVSFTADDPGATFECSLDAEPFAACASPVEYTDLADGRHEARVRATDPVGNVEAEAARHVWTVVVPPETSIESGPAELTNDSTATFVFDADENGSTFECSLDGDVWLACVSPTPYAGLGDGEHVFRVRAIDPAGNVDPSPASRSWVVDTTVPVVTVSGPEAETEERSATLTFAVDGDAALACLLNGETLPDCASPVLLAELELGDYVLEVRATDAAGNTATASWSWSVVDVTAPTITLSGPGAETEDANAIFTFSADEAATFTCALDEIPVFACTSPVTHDGLELGPHRFEVEAADGSGNTGSAAHAWTVVDRTAPVVTIAGPGAETEETSASLSFSADEPADLRCRVDDQPFAACAAGLAAYADLALGLHRFEVTATDPSGNTGVGAYSWTVVDRTAPVVSITGPDPETEETSATLVFSADEDATFSCSLDGLVVDGCSSPLVRGGLLLGEHELSVQAVDASGNAGFAEYSWTVVDRTAPTVTLTGPPAETEETSATLTFTASEPAAVACTLDGDAVADCASPLELTGLGHGSHTVVVEATDASGNTGSATHAWTVVDRTAPVLTLSGPAAETEETTATLTFSANEPVTFACTLNAGDLPGCSSPVTLTDLVLGEYVFEVLATDGSGNTGSATHAWTVVDRTTPTVTLNGPPPETEDTSATLTFSADEEATFACVMDGATVGDCASPLEWSGLGLGPHTLVVEATDASGNTGSATHSWTIVDLTAPAVTIVGPPAETEAKSARLTFSAGEPVELRCRLDGAAFAPCGSGGADYSELALGSHTFDVEAEDASGNVGEATHAWTIVDRTAPVVTLAGPPAETESRSASFTFSADEPASLRCRLDAAPLADCASGAAEYSELALGAHTFEVEASDPSGNAGSATHTWTIVDRTAPVVTLTGPPAETEETSATLTFSASEPVTFACTLNGADLPGCSSPVELTDLALGDYVFEVRATDASANTATATWSWTVVEKPPPPDTTPPTISLGGPPDETDETSAAFTFTADEPATFLCALDSSSFTSCSAATGATYAELAPGPHRFVVQATDGAGNSATADWSWTILEPPPPQDTGAPEIRIDGPDAETEETTATFVFSANESATFECALDTAAFTPCSAFVSYGGLQPGAHEFRLRATDAAGNSATATWLWTIVEPPPPPDTTPPVISLGGPPAETQATSATFTFSANEPATFRCALDDGAFASCATGVSYTGLALGPHTFVVQATDAADNVGTAAHAWRIVAPPAACSGGTVTASANADSWVLETSPTSNYGRDSILKVDTKLNANAQALVRFALPAIPAGCSLLDARLRLYAGSYKTGRSLQAYALGGAWSETGVTWTTTPATTGAVATAPSGAGYVVWSVATQVQGMYAGANNGFLVRDVSRTGAGSEQGFHSREKGTDNPPQLVLTFG